jgi:uncharacterized cupredoxin-like copper-binding protein
MLLAAVALVIGGPAVAQQPTVLNVEMSNFEFTPNRILLEHGRPYVLRLANAADGGHNFTAREFFAAAAVAAEDRRYISDGAVEVPPGQVREIRLTAPAAGEYRIKCTHSLHKLMGMSGKIIVR